MSRKLHEICTSQGCAMVWADGIEEARRLAKKKIAMQCKPEPLSLCPVLAAFLLIMIALVFVLYNASAIDAWSLCR